MSYGSYPPVPPSYPQQQQQAAPFATVYPYGYVPAAYAAYSLPPATHPPTGVISFVLGLLSILGVFLLFVVAVVAASQQAQGVSSEGRPHVVLIGGLFILSILFAFVGILLAFVGLLQSSRRRVFPILGLSINLLVLGFLIVLMLAGVAAANR